MAESPLGAGYINTLSQSILIKPGSNTWSLPNSFEDVVNFALHFDGNKQPIIHDYPWSVPIVAIAFYWLLVYLGPKYMENRKAWNLRWALILWNLGLTIASVFMFVGMFVPVLKFLIDKGFNQLVCMPDRELYFGIPFFCCWLFALSKYGELIDTVFIILRKRPLHFIHWYHHTTVLVYTWFSLVVMTPPGALFAVVNTFVHSIMYFYYFLAACGSRPSWGRFVTIIQLTQMVAGITISSFWTYYYLSEHYRCPLEHANAYMFSTLALYASYFLLFLNFYLQRYIFNKPVEQTRPNISAGLGQTPSPPVKKSQPKQSQPKPKRA